MRLWAPQKRWKKMLLTTLLVILAVSIGIVGYFEWSVYREVASDIEVLNEEGAKTVLIIYHPGLTDFARNVTYSFANGLVSRGWRVEIATASSQAPTDLSDYSLLLIGWPIYDFNPGPTITNHIDRIGDLNGIDTVIMVIAGGMDPWNAQEGMNKKVQNANGNIIATLQAFRGGTAAQDMFTAASNIIP